MRILILARSHSTIQRDGLAEEWGCLLLARITLPSVGSFRARVAPYEYLIRKFKEGAAAGEQYAPRDVVQLLVQLVLADVEHTLKKANGTLVAIYDPAAGTGGMLTVAKEYLTSECCAKRPTRSAKRMR